MTINKFTGKTLEEARAKVKSEMGPDAVIMSERHVKAKGLFAFLKPAYFEVTAAKEDDESYVSVNSPTKTDETGETTVEVNKTETKATEAEKSPSKLSSIDMKADEDIDLNSLIRAAEKVSDFVAAETRVKETSETTSKEFVPKPVINTEVKQPSKSTSNTDVIEEKFDLLQNMLEEKLSGISRTNKENLDDVSFEETSESVSFIKLMYKTLIENEVDEVYANRLSDEVLKSGNEGASMDFLLSNVYQKLILDFGTPDEISAEGNTPKVIFFIGPTGVGKTTTIAKIASKYKINENKKVVFLTADTYRIAATEQLKVYANIIQAPFKIIYSPVELTAAVDEYKDADLIFVDTAGFSHKNEEQKNDTKNLLEALPVEYEKKVYLVLSATTKYTDLKEICDMYKSISAYSLIFTKLDETGVCGSLFNIKQYSGAAMSYITNGQNVPEDIEVFKPQIFVKKLLGGEN